MGFPYTDFSAGYDFEELSGNLLDRNGSLDLTLVGTVPSIDPGKFGKARGPTLAIGSPGPDYWNRSHTNGDGWDIRGATSMAAFVWVQLGETTGQPNAVSIHDTVLAAGQAFVLNARETNSGNIGSPRFTMHDGITPFVGAALDANAANDLAMATGIWQAVGCSYDAPTNEIRCFWGVSPGVSHFNTAAGVAAGFGYSGTPAGIIAAAKHTGGGVPATLNMDSLLFWNNRSLTQLDFLNLWNNHVGLSFSQLGGQPRLSLIA